MISSSSPAMALIILKVEPGGYRPLKARLFRGFSGSSSRLL